MKTSRLTIKGQITVPKKLRDAFGWPPHTEIEFQQLDDGVKLTKAKKSKGRGDRIVKGLLGSGNRKMRTDEIMALTRGEP